MTLRYIDWKQEVEQEPNPLQQVALNHRGLFIDRPLNVQVVLIDQPWSSQAASRGCRGGCRAGELKSHYAQVSAQSLMWTDYCGWSSLKEH